MIKRLRGLPEGVVGFEIAGRVEADEYREVVLPAVEGAAADGEIRFLIEIPTFTGMSGEALWQDLKLGVEHLRAFKRVAVVTDLEWIHHLTGLFGWMTPGETKVFAGAQRDEAIAWVTA